MKESIWGYAIIVLGIIAIVVIWFMANVTRTDQHNYNLLRETTEAAMFDALDKNAYKNSNGEIIKINKEMFVQSFLRRFAQNADLSNEYKIEIFDINENPPKVSIRVSSARSTNVTSADGGEIITFDIVNNIDAILESTETE